MKQGSQPKAQGLHPGAKEHYVDALAYEARYEGRSEDVDFYLRHVRRQDSVLEYGCGAGRLTLPLLKKCERVLGVDTSQAMVDLLSERASSLPPALAKKLQVEVADMRTFRTRKKFDAVIAGFHTVCHLYSLDDIALFLGRARAHLVSGGRLMFDLPLPRADMPEYDPISQVRVTEMDGPSGPQLLTQRWYFPQEILLHLHYAGFQNARLRSDFTSALVDKETSVYTVVATAP